MTAAAPLLPSLSRYDPRSSSEGTLDPLGLYQVADQLATTLVPAVRERMVRIRFLTAMTVGAAVLQELEGREADGEASPQLIWEWLVVEAIIRHANGGPVARGVPGSQVTRRALNNHGYLDAVSYLKTPRIFGFHGVYKRLAVQLRLLDVNLAPGPHADLLLNAWAKDRQFTDFSGMKEETSRWREGVARSQHHSPPRTNPKWTGARWSELAEALDPNEPGRREQRVLRDLLMSGGTEPLGALPDIWGLGQQHKHDTLNDRRAHRLLRRSSPRWRPLLNAITACEAFARSLQDCFDAMRAAAGSAAGHGYRISDIKSSSDFASSADGLSERFRQAADALDKAGEAVQPSVGLFSERFHVFGGELRRVELALALLDHHDAIQRAKSAEGKRSWVDRLGPDRIHLRFPYRLDGWAPSPGAYVHPYRTRPVLDFLRDLR
ncbi:MAG: hypothetical protein ABR602_11050 [Gemmatimonadales bacterium]